MVAVLNNYGGFYQRWLYVFELQKAGANVYLPCVNDSEDKICIRRIDSWLGYVGMSGFEEKWRQLIPEELKQNGSYKDLEDFIRRTQITIEQCKLLIRIGAFRFTGKNKKYLLWEVHKYFKQKTT
jgi:DNA polymerase III alpha subunit